MRWPDRQQGGRIVLKSDGQPCPFPPSGDAMPRGRPRTQPQARCPKPEHRGSTTYAAGTYTTKNGRRQRYRCEPLTGAKHTFTVVLEERVQARDRHTQPPPECQRGHNGGRPPQRHLRDPVSSTPPVLPLRARRARPRRERRSGHAPQVHNGLAPRPRPEQALRAGNWVRINDAARHLRTTTLRITKLAEAGALTANTVSGVAWFDLAELDAHREASQTAEQRVPLRKTAARKLPKQTRRPPPSKARRSKPNAS